MTKPIPYPLRGEWLITDDGADLVRGVWETAQITGKAERIALALEARAGEPFKNERRCVVDNGIAVLDIDGPLMRKAELFSDISGATSYQWIGATVDALRTDPSVKKVIIRANSPGGEAAGCGECGEKIAKLAAEKHVEGYVETQAASAMYWLLSQCSHVTAHQTAQIGWIGAIRTLVDDSERDAKDGVKRRQIVSKGAENKRSFPVDKAFIDRVQRATDEWGQLFTAAVAGGRGVSEEHVLEKFGGGDGMFAGEALDVGLIDAIGDFESTLAGLSDVRGGAGGAGSGGGVLVLQTRNIKGANMATKPNDGVRAADADNEWKCGGCSEMMGPSATRYCTKCAADDDDDEQDDEDEAKALGLDVKATRGARRARAAALVALEGQIATATGLQAHEHEKIVAVVTESLGARAEIAKVKADGQKAALCSMLERGIAGGPGKQPTLSLGQIQKNMATALRGPTRKAWVAAMDKLVADADVAAKEAGEATDPKVQTALLAKSKVTAAQIIEAACSVQLSTEDLESLQDYAATSSPVAASTFAEPARDGVKEAAELDAKVAGVAKAADAARAALDKNKPAAK